MTDLEKLKKPEEELGVTLERRSGKNFPKLDSSKVYKKSLPTRPLRARPTCAARLEGHPANREVIKSSFLS